jgi:hypothetical protein
MRRTTTVASMVLLPVVLAVVPVCAQGPVSASDCGVPPAVAAGAPGDVVNLTQRLSAGQLRGDNREVAALPGSDRGVHVTEGSGPGVIWIDGTDFRNGSLAVDVCGRDVYQRSFLGLAFRRVDDERYEGVYLRPFNFRADDAARHQHAIQYIAVPDHDWPRLRQDSPEEFENPVDSSVVPTAWIPLRLVVNDQSVQIFVGGVASPALTVRRLGTGTGGIVGLWVGNGSDGNFANLRLMSE